MSIQVSHIKFNTLIPQTSNVSFGANSTTNTLEKSPEADRFEPKCDKHKNPILTLGAIILAGIGVFGAVKLGKSYQQKRALQEIEKKFAELQNDMPKVQKTFKEVFIREDLTEKEALEMLNRYKEVEKIRITGSKKDYAKAVFEEGKKNYKIYNSDMKISFQNVPQHEFAFGGCPRTNSQILMTDMGLKSKHSTIFEVIHHELRHAKQNELMYNYAHNDSIKKVIYTDYIIEKFPGTKLLDYSKELRNKIDSCDFSDPKVRQHLDNEFHVSEMIEKNFGKPSVDKIPKGYEKLTKQLIEELETTIHYPQRLEERDAFEAGKKMKDLICIE